MGPPQRFSERFGLADTGRADLVVADAPQTVRLGILEIACECGAQLGILRAVLCQEFRRQPRKGTSGADLWDEVRDLIERSVWPKVYDAAEAIYELIRCQDGRRAEHFELEVNRLLRNENVGFEMLHGRVLPRQEKAHEVTTAQRVSSGAILRGRVPDPTHSAECRSCSVSLQVASEPSNSLSPTTGSATPKRPLKAMGALFAWLVAVSERPGITKLASTVLHIVKLVVNDWRGYRK